MKIFGDRISNGVSLEESIITQNKRARRLYRNESGHVLEICLWHRFTTDIMTMVIGELHFIMLNGSFWRVIGVALLEHGMPYFVIAEQSEISR